MLYSDRKKGYGNKLKEDIKIREILERRRTSTGEEKEKL